MNPSALHIPILALAEIESLYDAGRYVEAHALAVEHHGPLDGWRGGAGALVFAGRLAGNLGGERLGYALTLRACRRLKNDPEATPVEHASAALFHAYRVYGQRGPLAVRRLLARSGVRAAFESGGNDEIRANVLCLQAHVAAAYRDADAAETLWQQAYEFAPASPWTWRERAALLVTLDRYPEAHGAARESLRLRPWYRPTVQQLAHILTLLNRDDEAVSLLEDALDEHQGGLESAAVAEQLAGIYAELQRPADALRALDRFEAFSPLLEEPGRRQLASRRGEARLLLNDLPGAADAADSLAETSFFHAKTAERLRDPARQTARRVTLPVPFVRQHEKTCAPATLAALSHFWNRPADQAAITQEIWYGGTFDHQERRWAETHGWVAREFRADWPSAVALLDAGIPFALVTTGVNTGHLQAGIGYDARRGTLIIRDPFERNQSEALAEEFFHRHAFCGPRAMALVPADDAAAVARLQAIDLPEAALHDNLYELRRALHVHDRPAARAALDALETVDPGARLTLLGHRELAVYDGDDPAILAAVEGLLALFPDEHRLRLEKLYALRRLARPVEAREALETWVADPKTSEPNLWRELAVELAADARQHSRARQSLARALFYQPTEPAHLRALADLRWEERDFIESTALGRLAACAATTREDYWQHFFAASRHLRETDVALRLLDARFRRLGSLSAQPARTLYWAHRERHAAAPAAAVLAEALRRRPDDGEMLLFAASAHARDGAHARAAECLAAARGKASAGHFERTAAELCNLRGDLVGALGHWRELLVREPLDTAAHQAVARLIAETDPRGPAAAREELDAVVARFPHAVALHELRVQSLVGEPGRGSPEHVAAVETLLAVQTTHVWARRELALAHLSRRDPAAALRVLDEAEHLHPLAPPTHALRGRALLIQGEQAAARESLRRALSLDAGVPGVPAALLETCPASEEKRGVLDFVHDELRRQSGGTGDGILAYRAAAYPFLSESDLQGRLGALLAGRPDLWQAWSAAAWQHADAGRLDEAQASASGAAERFPLLPRVWLDLAAIEKIRGDDEAQIAALTRALRSQADNGEASRQLAAAHRRTGRFTEARTVLAQAIAAAPLDVANRGALAETLWQEGSGEVQEPKVTEPVGNEGDGRTSRKATKPQSSRKEEEESRGLKGSRASRASAFPSRAWERGREDSSFRIQAVEIVTDALWREPGYEWGWSALERYATALGQPERLEGAARLLTTTRPGEARSWLKLAQMLPGETGAALDERLAALDRALALNPRSEDAHDLRASLLATAGRFDEALAACEPPAEIYPGGTRPFTLEGRAAWVLARRGDLPGARAKMRGVLAAQPGYEWGWRLLADWAEAAGDKDEAMAAAERLAFLDPHAAGPLGYLAAARLQRGQRAEAKRDLAEAMRRDRAYLYAPITLLNTQLEDREFDAAEQTLAWFRQHHPGTLALSRTVLAAARRRDQTRARQALEGLAALTPAPGSGDGGLQEAVKAVAAAGWPDMGEAVLRAAMRQPAGTGHPEAGPLWVRSRATRGGWRGLAADMERMDLAEDASRRALVVYVETLGTHRQGQALRKILRRQRAVLRATTEAWGQAGYALVTCGFHRDAVKWMADWRERPDVGCWMLFNLTAALRATRRYAEALTVGRHALKLPPDSTRPRLVAWVALEDALSTEPDAAGRAASLYAEIALRSAETAQPFPYIRALVKHMVAIRGAASREQRRQLWRESRRDLREQRKGAAAFLRDHTAVRLADRRARRRMTRDAGAWGAWLGVWLSALTPKISAPKSQRSPLRWWILVYVLLHLLGWLMSQWK